jgi:FkbM family methyltransferase
MNNFLNSISRKVGLNVKKLTPVSDQYDLLLHHSKRCGVRTVIDAGANVGQFAQRFISTGWTGDILSIEPLSSAYAALERLAAGEGKWHIAPRCALGATKEQLAINLSQNSASSSLLDSTDILRQIAPQAKYIDTEVVDIVRLDDLLVQSDVVGPFLLKMDVQGYESKVLDGAAETIAQIPVIYTEMSLSPIYDGEDNFAELSKKIIDMGYKCIGLFPGYFDGKSREIYQADGIFIKEDSRF